MSGARRSIATTDQTLALLGSGGANRGRPVDVVGGGIAGLATALAFARSGAEVTVHEQAPELTEVGAGIQVTPNGARVLDGLGLAEVASRRAIRADAVEPRDALTGRPVTRFDLRKLSGPPYRFFHRYDLIDMLAEGCRAAGVTIRTGQRIEPLGDRPVERADGALLIGADGLHSVLRPLLNEPAQPFFTGQVAWRATVAVESPPVARIWMAPGRHVVTYPLQGGRLNIVAVREQADWAAEGWHHLDDPANLQAAFADTAPELRTILGAVTSVNLWGLFRHPVAQRWHNDDTAIIGDAAHPTLPFLAQGANLALEDAYVLARCCDTFGDLPTALARYQALRQDRVARAIAAANANAVNYHLAGMKRRVAHLGLKGLGVLAPRAFLGRMDWLYGHDVTAIG